MKKGNFKIKLKTEKRGWKMEEVSGFLSENFGIHRAGDKRSDYQFVITHIKTGLALGRYDRLGLARAIVAAVESEKDWPMPWNASSIADDYKHNSSKARAVINNVIYSQPHRK